MGRKILFITSDQQRYDALGCNGGTIARTPVLDALSRAGITFDRAHPQNVVCMPSRSTMLTGQHVSTHGVWMNGVPLPEDAPSIAADLRGAGYATALIGKAHFEPLLDPFLRFTENRLGAERVNTNNPNYPHRGFDHMELATHGAVGQLHYSQWVRENHPEATGSFYNVLDRELQVNAEGGGDTNAPQIKVNAIPREWYHTDWVAQRTIAWLQSLPDDRDWFCWMSFPDPHHPWDPPASEMHRVNWKDLELPEGYIADAEKREKIIDSKLRQWRGWYDGTFVSNYEAPAKWVPATLTADQVREVNAYTHVENELIDEAIGSVMKAIESRGWGNDLDVLYTTDHGEFQGDFGFLFKGPYHVDALMRLPLIWRPAPSSNIEPARVSAPVGLVSIAATFAHIAGLEQPSYVEAPRLPHTDNDATTLGHERVLTEWDSVLFGKIVHLRTICRDNWVCTAALPGTMNEAGEGELYDLTHDPLQHVNLWSDPKSKAMRESLLADMWDNLPQQVTPLRHMDAPV
jgi:arylsulfatase A-like enzyme